MMIKKDVIIIGAGPAGLAAALEVKRNGLDDVLVIEREQYSGGILNQCIHDGFGLVKFKETLTGPEYAKKYIDEIKNNKIEIKNGAMVIDINTKREVTVISREGLQVYCAGAVILAMGCRERTRGALSIPGTRPAGVYTAGVAQHYVNIDNIMVGKRVVILGSGDIGLIMARRLTLEGAEVMAVVEKLPYPSGLPRNIVQCLEDYNIPLILSHTVINISGRERLKSVTVAKVNEKGEPLRGTRKKFDCDTLILSVGLIPENEIAQNAKIKLDEVTNGAVVDENLQTSIEGVFACGNVLQVHDLVDHVSSEGEQAGRSAALFVKNRLEADNCAIPVKAGNGIRYVLPQLVSSHNNVVYSMRVSQPFKDKTIVFRNKGKVIKTLNYKKLNPAEMVRIKLKASEMKDIEELEVSIDV